MRVFATYHIPTSLVELCQQEIAGHFTQNVGYEEDYEGVMSAVEQRQCQDRVGIIFES